MIETRLSFINKTSARYNTKIGSRGLHVATSVVGK